MGENRYKTATKESEEDSFDNRLFTGEFYEDSSEELYAKGYIPEVRELEEEDPYANKLYARCVYKNDVVEDIDVTGKSILDIAKRKDENNGMISFQIHKKKVVKRKNGMIGFQINKTKTTLPDDIEISQSYDFGMTTYFGEKVSAYDYYQRTIGRLPIDMIDEVTDKLLTPQDLLRKYYVVFADGRVIKNPDIGFKTFNEVLEFFQEKNVEQEEKHEKGL